MRKLLLTAASVAALGIAVAGHAQPGPPSMDQLYQTIGNSVAMAAANAVYAQQQANVTYQAATTVATDSLFGVSSSRLGAIAADTRARAVVEAQLPGLTTHPSFPTIRDMTLPQVAAHSGGRITAEHLDAIAAGLAAIR